MHETIIVQRIVKSCLGDYIQDSDLEWLLMVSPLEIAFKLCLTSCVMAGKSRPGDYKQASGPERRKRTASG